MKMRMFCLEFTQEWSGFSLFFIQRHYDKRRNGKIICLKAKLSFKIKIFLWYLKKGVTLTKDNLVKRHWNGCTKY
jgi:hypothetical protein